MKFRSIKHAAILTSAFFRLIPAFAQPCASLTRFHGKASRRTRNILPYRRKVLSR